MIRLKPKEKAKTRRRNKKRKVINDDVLESFMAIANLFGHANRDDITVSEEGCYLKAAHELRNAGYSVDKFPIIHAYCHEKFDTHTASALPKHAKAAMREQEQLPQEVQGYHTEISLDIDEPKG
jgi:hypothetical protein